MPSGADSRALYNDDAATGAGGVVGTSNAQYVSGGADYAEWIECGDPSEWSDIFSVEDYEAFVESRRGTGLLGLPEGIIVFVRDDGVSSAGMSQFYKSGPGRPMVVTGRAMIVGNEVAEVESEKLLGAQVSFIGQVPVIVEGPCSQGDLILPTEGNICKAVPQDIVTFEQYRSAVGTAFGSKSGEGTSAVIVGIGVK